MPAAAALGAFVVLRLLGSKARSVTWSPRSTVEDLEGFRRAQEAEVGPEARARAPEFLRYELGTVHEFRADGGRLYVAAVETHDGPTPENPTWHPHKGVSLFVEAR